ncbi:MAG: hypothetical protein IIC29_10015, partial [Chloroflexi bacterium]|nr:hypothetical protein [Chloroflexota bacterium]
LDTNVCYINAITIAHVSYVIPGEAEGPSPRGRKCMKHLISGHNCLLLNGIITT